MHVLRANGYCGWLLASEEVLKQCRAATTSNFPEAHAAGGQGRLTTLRKTRTVKQVTGDTGKGGLGPLEMDHTCRPSG